MPAAVTTLGSYLAAPGNLLVVLLALGLLALIVRARRLSALLFSVAAVAALIIAVLPVGDWLLRPLENRFPIPATLPERIDGIVVLGGTMDSAVTASRGAPALNERAERLTAAVVLARRYPAARIVVASGDAGLFPQDIPEAPAMRDVLVALGIEPARILIEDRSRNTAENARFASEVARPQAVERWVLVTSAFHMPRAVGCFRRIDWDVIPYPVDHMTHGGGRGAGLWFDLRRGLNRLHPAIHEWVALAIYRHLDRTDALLPAPREGTHPIPAS